MMNIESSTGEIVMYQPDEALHLEVRVEDETVWLTQAQMSDLFSVKEHTVTYHIKEIYKSEELEKKGTARKIRVVRKEGNRNVNRTLDYYNLDMIILCFLLSTILHWCTTNIALEVFVEEGVIGKMQSVGDFQYRHGGKSKH